MSGIRHDVDEMCAIVACYTALPTFRDNLLVSFSRVKDAKKKGLGKELPIRAAQRHARAQISCVALFICAEIHECLDEPYLELDKLIMEPNCCFNANLNTNFP